jgi:hydrogenase expression/formation protein HypC
MDKGSSSYPAPGIVADDLDSFRLDDRIFLMCLAVPGQIKEIYESMGLRMGKVSFGGIVKEVCLAYLPDSAVGDYTIVHVGFAITQVDEASALRSLDAFREMGLLAEEFGEPALAITEKL